MYGFVDDLLQTYIVDLEVTENEGGTGWTTDIVTLCEEPCQIECE
jgi:hypothetical protein